MYDAETRRALSSLKAYVDTHAALHVWQEALSFSWQQKPVWVHGDIGAGNIVVDGNNGVVAVIDFGCLGIGDPACDLVAAWTLFSDESRERFKQQINLDKDTWKRAQGWALWKALISFDDCTEKEGAQSQRYLAIINDVLSDR